ncbi:YhzD family protein [Bacillus marinisedimentorum]|uniref:YhzD family protein n=1 Tax=Bacillus marinisedimentorum TaxID=1821260 RepID=UPI0007DE6F32|nr:YhzD family protein [Bacillus marinisedimentorum]
MKTYTLTVFDDSGEKLLEETYEAPNDNDAKQIGENRIEDEGYDKRNYRVTSSAGELVAFNSSSR